MSNTNHLKPPLQPWSSLLHCLFFSCPTSLLQLPPASAFPPSSPSSQNPDSYLPAITQKVSSPLLLIHKEQPSPTSVKESNERLVNQFIVALNLDPPHELSPHRILHHQHFKEIKNQYEKPNYSDIAPLRTCHQMHSLYCFPLHLAQYPNGASPPPKSCSHIATTSGNNTETQRRPAPVTPHLLLVLLDVVITCSLILQTNSIDYKEPLSLVFTFSLSTF